MRFDLWDKGQWAELLVRVEEQVHERYLDRNRKSKLDATRGRAMRAKLLVREGAYRKGVTSLGTGLATLTPAEEIQWVEKLLPSSNHADIRFPISQFIKMKVMM